MNSIITVGREFGSGGRELGRKLAKELGIQYYDREIITRIAEETEMSENYVSQIVEKTPRYLFPITIGHSFTIINDYQIKQMQTVYQAQSDIIKQLAQQSSCVIIGRCADFILRDMHPCRIFVYADLPSRIKRCFARKRDDEDLTEKEMKNKIISLDKNRAKYYQDFTGQKWGDRLNYDFCLNTTDMNIDYIVPYLARMMMGTEAIK